MVYGWMKIWMKILRQQELRLTIVTEMYVGMRLQRKCGMITSMLFSVKTKLALAHEQDLHALGIK